MLGNRQIKLGMHTYTLHFFGFCESGDSRENRPPRTMSLEELMDKAVEWELDGLQITKVDLGVYDDKNLAKVRRDAEDRKLFLEFNASFDSENDSRINCNIDEALDIGYKLGCQLVKFSLDLTRGRILYGSCMNPEIMKQLVEKFEIFQKAVPKIEEYGMKIAIENHTDTFADEIMWLINKLNHPLIGACVDTCNPIRVLEDPFYAMEIMLPKSYCCHFSDDIIVVDSLGVRDIGAAHGQGSLDCPRMVQQILEKSPMDTIIFENEIALLDYNEPIEEARAREMKACEESIRYLRDVLKLGVRNR